MRRKIKKADAKRFTEASRPGRWAEFEAWMKERPGRRATFYRDCGLVYAELGDGSSFHLYGSYGGRG